MESKPAYVGISHLDATQSKDDVQLGCAMKGIDLDWEVLADNSETNEGIAQQLQLSMLLV